MSTSADLLIIQRKFQEAVFVLEELKIEQPDSLEINLKLCICLVFSRREQEALDLYHTIIFKNPVVPEELLAFWQASTRLFAKLSMAGLVLAGCTNDPPQVHPNDVQSHTIASEPPTDVETSVVEEKTDVDVEDNQIIEQPIVDIEETEPQPVKVEPPQPVIEPKVEPPPKEETYSAHRYSAGIHRNKRTE